MSLDIERRQGNSFRGRGTLDQCDDTQIAGKGKVRVPGVGKFDQIEYKAAPDEPTTITVRRISGSNPNTQRERRLGPRTFTNSEINDQGGPITVVSRNSLFRRPVKTTYTYNPNR